MKQLIIMLSVLLLLGGIGCSGSGGGLSTEPAPTGGGQPGALAEPVLAWDAPVYDDGTPVDGVAGYKIYYGTAPGTYTASITTGASTSYSISQFSSALTATGTYYMAVTAFDTDGMESAYSNEISRDF